MKDESSPARFRSVALLFVPAIAALNRLSYARKFLFVGLLLLAPFGYVTHLLIKVSDQQIDFNQKERFGVTAITPAFQFLRHVEMCRLHAIAGLVGAAPALGELKHEIDLASGLIPRLDALDEKYRDSFRGADGRSAPSETWTSIKARWSALHATHFDDADDAAAAYDALSSAVTAWILDIANFSNLILDPDLDSYWLMDAFVQKLPTIVASLARASTLALGDTDASDTFSWRSAAELDLAGLYVIVGRLLADASVNLRTAYDYNSVQGGHLLSTLDPVARRAVSDTQVLLDIVRARQTAPARTADDELLRAAATALDGVYALHEAIGPELDGLVAARVDTYRSNKRLAMLVAGGTTFLLVYIFAGFYLAMRRSVTTLGDFTRRLIAGTAETFRLDTRDELGAVAEMYNDLNATLTNIRTLKVDLEARTENLRRTNQTLVHTMNERKRLETQLVQAQKLESIGQLAAGIAHEINTPAQYIGDNLRFVRDGFRDIGRLLEACNALGATVDRDTSSALSARVEETFRDADTQYLCDEIPKALDQAIEGVERVSDIVRAMKEFSHPDSREREPHDLNRAIMTTITVARNEWKYVAEVATDLDPDLPPVLCFAGQLSQALLNIVVNAAHAIAERNADHDGAKGTITVGTRRDGDWVEIRISDTGGGIPDAIRNRIFDPFFTTKEVGKGTGQGLAIAHGVVVDKHHGEIRVETEVGHGTTFILRLPLEDAPEAERPYDGMAGRAA